MTTRKKKSYFSQIGSLGGLVRNRIHGNPGTSEGRRRGGVASMLTHKTKKTGFKTLQAISFPPHSSALAELVGIFMGDGHVGKYQASVTTHSKTDRKHAEHTQSLVKHLFGVVPALRKKRGVNACEVVISSKEICRFLNLQGLPQGNKVRDGVNIPTWILTNPLYAKAFVRGLFDTDGSVYLDIHRRKNKTYKYMGMAFTNHCPNLLLCFKQTVEALGLHPTQKTTYIVFLRREEEICTYFKLIGTSNPKHERRFQVFCRIRHIHIPGGVA